MSWTSFLTGLVLGAVAGAIGFSANQAFQVKLAYGECKQTYPNIPGRLLLENDKVVVQRFSFPPGQWEGVHAHPTNQLYIHLTDANWKVRFGEETSTGSYPAGSVGWYGSVDLGDDHESMNIGEEPIDLIWVTLKDEC